MSSPTKLTTSRQRTALFCAGLVGIVHGALVALAGASSVEVVVSVPEQKLYVFNDSGDKVASYKISTAAKFGDERGTYATPLGKLEIANKIGGGAEVGTVFKGKFRTGEIVPINAKGRDPIVTRILHLRGTETQNQHAYSRCIFIHGTPDERHLGRPVSDGCLRMASADVVQLFDMVDVGSSVEITKDRVTNMFGNIVRPMKVQAIASASNTTPPSAAVSTKVAAAQPPAMPAAQPARSGRAASLPVVASGPMFPSQTKSDTARHVSEKQGGSHVKLLETSGLTISFGGGIESSDRPR